MGKTITSPVERWPGSVVIADPMTLPQVLAFETALEERRGFFETEEEGEQTIYRLKPGVWFGAPDGKALEAVFACVEKWEIDNFPDGIGIDTIPMTPRPDSHRFIEWLLNEITAVYIGEVEIPNE